jgi:hypothetical protein
VIYKLALHWSQVVDVCVVVNDIAVAVDFVSIVLIASVLLVGVFSCDRSGGTWAKGNRVNNVVHDLV